MQTLIILGRQPALGLAELESLYGAESLTPVGDQAVAVDIPASDIDFSRLGSMVKFCKILTPLPTTNWGKIQKFLEQAVPSHASNLPEGKLQLGLSVYGLDVSPQRIMATGLTLKKALKGQRSVRLVQNTEKDLNAAQVLHNGLTRKMGWELVFVKHGDQTIVAQSIAVQDIDAYRRRDQERPMRDARVGMLPPKLAQIIINLANPEDDSIVLDPFCGTGVLLQESLLMGYPAIGTDLETRMVEFSLKNLEWLLGQYPERLKNTSSSVNVADATSHAWKEPYGTIACETYLGRALSSMPDQETLHKIVTDCSTIHKKFLLNVARQTSPGFRMCIAVPAWKTRNGFKHMPVLDSLEELGYTRMSFAHASNEDLIYHRTDQIVARELVVLIRK